VGGPAGNCDRYGCRDRLTAGKCLTVVDHHAPAIRIFEGIAFAFPVWILRLDWLMTMICHSLYCCRERFVFGNVKHQQVVFGCCGARAPGLSLRKFEMNAVGRRAQQDAGVSDMIFKLADHGQTQSIAVKSDDLA